MIKVCIYEDDQRMLKTLVTAIEESSDLKLEAAFTNCNNVIDDYKKYKPDLILIGIEMPETDGIEGLIKLRIAGYLSVKVIMLTVFVDYCHILKAIVNGANGYILKATPYKQLIEYIKDTYEGGSPLDSSIANEILKAIQAHFSKDLNEFNLTSREIEVIKCLAKGCSYKMIAETLSISVNTVRGHIRRIYDKMHVNSSSEAVSMAYRSKLLS